MPVWKDLAVCKMLSDFLKKETVRYLIFGVLTVAVNIAAYHLLSWGMGTLAANTIAFFIAVFFAYWTNTRFVFCVPFTKKNFIQFLMMRIGTLLLDDGGMLLLIDRGWNDFLVKCIVNGVIIAINYVCSKLLIFRKTKGGGER